LRGGITAGLTARNVGATLAVARGRRERFFAALRMTGTRGTAGTAARPTGSILVRKKSGGRFVNRPYGPYPKQEGVIKGETRCCPLEIASARSAGD
jgi:lipoprotein-anchoring transpeptidase ErfK/SrfK